MFITIRSAEFFLRTDASQYPTSPVFHHPGDYSRTRSVLVDILPVAFFRPFLRHAQSFLAKCLPVSAIHVRLRRRTGAPTSSIKSVSNDTSFPARQIPASGTDIALTCHLRHFSELGTLFTPVTPRFESVTRVISTGRSHARQFSFIPIYCEQCTDRLVRVSTSNLVNTQRDTRSSLLISHRVKFRNWVGCSVWASSSTASGRISTLDDPSPKGTTNLSITSKGR